MRSVANIALFNSGLFNYAPFNPALFNGLKVDAFAKTPQKSVQRKGKTNMR